MAQLSELETGPSEGNITANESSGTTKEIWLVVTTPIRELAGKRSEKTMAKTEITLDQLLTDWDWGEVFGEGGGGNCDKATDEIPPGAEGINKTPPMRADVAEVIAAVNGENDGDEWIGVFRLNDGRFLVAAGGCDYTGWDCQASNSLQIAKSLTDAIGYGLTPEQKLRLEL
jgi:hypothetical protein